MNPNLLTRDEMKQVAITNLKALGVAPAYIRDFQNHGKITMFIQGFGFTINENTEDHLLEEIKRIEEEYHGMVYAVIKYRLGDDVVYGMLYISQYLDEVAYTLTRTMFAHIYCAYCYAYNASYNYNSEFGDIAIEGGIGGIKIYCGE